MANMNTNAQNQQPSAQQPMSPYSPSTGLPSPVIANAVGPESMAQKIERYRVEHMIRDPTTGLPVYTNNIYGYNDFFDAPVLPEHRRYEAPDVSQPMLRQRRKKYIDRIKALHDELNIVLEFAFGRNNETYVIQTLSYIERYLKQVNMQAWEQASFIYPLMEKDVNELSPGETQQWRDHNKKMETLRVQHSDENGKWANPRQLQGPTAGKIYQEVCHMHTSNAQRGMCACPRQTAPAPQPPRLYQNPQQRGTPQQQRQTAQNTMPQSYISPRMPPSQPPPQPRRQPWGPSIQQPPSNPTATPASPAPQLNPPKKHSHVDLTDDEVVSQAGPALQQAKKPRVETPPPPPPIREINANFLNTYGPGVPSSYLQTPTPTSQQNAMSARGITSPLPPMASPISRQPQTMRYSLADPRIPPKKPSPPRQPATPQIPASPSPPKDSRRSYVSPVVPPAAPQPSPSLASAPVSTPQIHAVSKPTTPSPPSQVPTPASAVPSPSSPSANANAVNIGQDFIMFTKGKGSQALKGFQVWSNGAIVDCRKPGGAQFFAIGQFVNIWDARQGSNEEMKADREKCVAWLKHVLLEWKKKTSPSP